MNIRIIVATHKPAPMPEDPMYYPLHVGKALTEGFGLPGDDTGENISQKNKRLCELTGLYWGWKNLDADYLGLVHYRRLFRARKGLPVSPQLSQCLTTEQAARLCQRHDIIVPSKRHYVFQTLEEHYRGAHPRHPKDLEVLRQSVAAVDPSYTPALERVLARKSGHMFNMLIASRRHLDEYCPWLFAVLEQIDANLDPSRERTPGCLSEFLLDVWLARTGYKYHEQPYLSLDSGYELRKRVSYLKRSYAGMKRRR